MVRGVTCLSKEREERVTLESRTSINEKTIQRYRDEEQRTSTDDIKQQPRKQNLNEFQQARREVQNVAMGAPGSFEKCNFAALAGSILNYFY